jgi:filamentous hemagglutinin
MQIDAIKAAGDTGKAVIVIGSFFLPGPEDAVMAAVLSKHGLTVIKNGGGYIVKRGATILSGKQERDALITVTTEVRKHGSDVSKLTGKSFEEYLAKLFGGKSSFTTNGREFDGAYGKVWYEAKSGQYWANQCKTKTQIGKFQSDIGDHLKIAKENGKLFELHSNTPIPSNIKKWLESKGIKYFEHL